jgi:hypothetical protein
MITRRHVLASALGTSALALAPGASFASAPAVPVGSIKVEFSPVVASAWGPNVAIVSSELQRQLTELLGPSFQRGAGTRLVVYVTSIWLSSDAGGGGGGGGRKAADGGGADFDYLESIVTLSDRNGRELGRWPIRSSEMAGSAGVWTLPDIQERRLKALGRNNAYWIKRYLG